MATATFVHEGDVIGYTPTVDVPAGTVVRHGFWVGVAKQAIAANKRGSLALTGVFDIPKPAGAGVTFDVGVDVFWSVTNGIGYPGQLDPGDAFMGQAVEAAADDDPTVRVRLQSAPNSHSAV
jgi:predicted RecA/RadA family phage recombinase